MLLPSVSSIHVCAGGDWNLQHPNQILTAEIWSCALWLRDHLLRQIVFARLVQSHQRGLVGLATTSLFAHITNHTTSVLSKWNNYNSGHGSKGFEKGLWVWGWTCASNVSDPKLNRLLRSKTRQLPSQLALASPALAHWLIWLICGAVRGHKSWITQRFMWVTAPQSPTSWRVEFLTIGSHLGLLYSSYHLINCWFQSSRLRHKLTYGAGGH